MLAGSRTQVARNQGPTEVFDGFHRLEYPNIHCVRMVGVAPVHDYQATDCFPLLAQGLARLLLSGGSNQPLVKEDGN